MNETPMIETRELSKTYRAGDVDVHALAGANLEAVSYTHLDVYKRQGSRS